MARAGQALALSRLGRLTDAQVIPQTDELPAPASPTIPDVWAELALAEGRLAEALTRAETVAESANSRGRTPGYLFAREIQTRALLRLGRPDEALTVVNAALPIAREMGGLPLVWRLLALKATALARLDPPSEAGLASAAAGEVIQSVAQTIDDAELRRGFLESPDVAAALRPAAVA